MLLDPIRSALPMNLRLTTRAFVASYGWLLLTAAVSVLAACASSPAVSPIQGGTASLFLDRQFRAPEQRPDPTKVFELSADMQRYLDEDMAPVVTRRGIRQGLIDALYSGDHLRLEYDATYTRDAKEAYAARSGNCLSLVIMTAAFARALGLETTFNRVSIDEQWRLSGKLMMAAGHVNLSLSRRRLGERLIYDINNRLTIDFLPPAELERQRSEPITEATIVGMYMNNRAAENLADERIDDAYWFAREAIVQAPAEVAGYNTLAVVYMRRGQDQAAERVLRLALQREPDNTRLLGNLVQLLEQQGREAERRPLAQRLQKLEPVPPYRDFHLGQAALREGRFGQALTLFTQELARSPEQPDAHFGLARAYLALGQVREARKHLQFARELSTSRGEAALYAAKLGRLPVQ